VKQGTGVSASLGAVASSKITIGCCLPLGFAAARAVKDYRRANQRT
jgi:hypothetical protein